MEETWQNIFTVSSLALLNKPLRQIRKAFSFKDCFERILWKHESFSFQYFGQTKKILTHTCRQLKPPKVVLEYWLRGSLTWTRGGNTRQGSWFPLECTRLTLSLSRHLDILFSAILRGNTTVREGSRDLTHLLLTYPLRLTGEKHFEVKKNPKITAVLWTSIIKKIRKRVPHYIILEEFSQISYGQLLLLLTFLVKQFQSIQDFKKIRFNKIC